MASSSGPHRNRPEVVHADHGDDEVGRERLEHAGQLAAEARRVGTRKAHVDHFDAGRAAALVPEALELRRIGLFAVQIESIGVGVAQAEDSKVPGDEPGGELAPADPQGERCELERALELEQTEQETQRHEGKPREQDARTALS